LLDRAAVTPSEQARRDARGRAEQKRAVFALAQRDDAAQPEDIVTRIVDRQHVEDNAPEPIALRGVSPAYADGCLRSFLKRLLQRMLDNRMRV
jgi:hypothetical protein